MIFTPKILSRLCLIVIIIAIASAGFGYDSKSVEWISSVGALMICLFLVNRLFNKESAPSPPLSLNLFVFVVLLSVLASVYIHASIIAGLPWILAAVAFWITLFTARSLKSQKIITVALLVLGLGLAVYGVYNFFLLKATSIGIAATFGWRNIYGGFLMLIIPLSLSLMISAKKKLQALILVILSSLVITNLVLTFSQGSWIAGTGGIILLLILKRKDLFKKEVLIRLLAAAVLVIALTSLLISLHSQLAFPEQEQNLAEAASFAEASTSNRLAYWQAALGISQDYPLLGIGLGNYQSVMTQYINNIWSFSVSPHNIVLYLLSGLGIFGLLAFLSFLAFVLIKTIRFLKDSQMNTWESGLVIGLACSVAASFAHALIDVDWEIPAILFILFIEIGLLLSIVGNKTENKLKILSTKAKSLIGSPIVIFAVFCLISYLLIALPLSKLNKEKALTAADNFDYEASENLLQKASSLMPVDADIHFELSKMYWLKVLDRKGEREENMYNMIRHAQKALSLDPENSKRHFTLGQAYSYSTNLADQQAVLAEKNLRKSLELNPYLNLEVYSELANLYLRQKRYQEAMAVCEEALSLYSEESIGKIFADQTRADGIRAEIEKIKSISKSARELL